MHGKVKGQEGDWDEKIHAEQQVITQKRRERKQPMHTL